MRELRQSTAATISIGPFVDYTSGVTAETGVTIIGMDNAGLIKNGAGSTVSVGGYAFSHLAGGHYGFQFSSSDTDTTGLLRLFFQDDSIFAPVWEDFMVLDPNIYDNKYIGTKQQVNSVQIGGVTLSGTGGVTVIAGALTSGVTINSIISSVTLPSSVTIGAVLSSVSIPSSVTISANVIGNVAGVTGNIGGSILGGVVGNVNGVTNNVTVGSIISSATMQSAVTVGVNNDKTGYFISGTSTTLDSLNDLNAGEITSNTNVNVISIASTVTIPSSVTVTVGANNDKTGYFISGTSTTLDSLNDLNAGEITSTGDWTNSEKQQIRHALGVSGTTSSAVSGQLQFIQDMIGGRWKIDTTTNQMIFYKEDNITVVATFDLKDKNANASWNNVFERTRS